MSTAEKICFVTGFGRSGTTVLTECIALAYPAPVLTTEDLAILMPQYATLLESLDGRDTPLDRGVDAREISPTMAEEYWIYLTWKTKLPGVRYKRWKKRKLQKLADTVAARGQSDTVVMKNPMDTTNEPALLRDFPSAAVVIVRRSLPEIESSMRAALERERGAHEYAGQLIAGTAAERLYELGWAGPIRQRLTVGISVWYRRWQVLRLATFVHRLPPERTALLSYDEFKTDANAAAKWASHLLDPEVLATEFSARSAPFGAGHQGARGTWVAEALDRYWAKSWERARARSAQMRP